MKCLSALAEGADETDQACVEAEEELIKFNSEELWIYIF